MEVVAPKLAAVPPREVPPIKRNSWVISEDNHISWRGVCDADVVLSDVHPVFDVRLLSVVSGLLHAWEEFTLTHAERLFWYRGLITSADGGAIVVVPLQLVHPIPDVNNAEHGVLPNGFRIVQDQQTALYWPVRVKDGKRVLANGLRTWEDARSALVVYNATINR